MARVLARRFCAAIQGELTEAGHSARLAQRNSNKKRLRHGKGFARPPPAKSRHHPKNQPMKQTHRLIGGVAALLFTTALTAFAGTEVAGKEAKEVTEVKPPEPRFKMYGWLEGGVTFNTDSP